MKGSGTQRESPEHVGALTVLLVEDDVSLGEALRDALEAVGWQVVWLTTGSDALASIERGDPVDVVLLDLGLPDVDGLDVCREIRRRGETPLIVVTARDDEIDRVLGLELGADDYLGKPVGTRELVARVRAVVRRSRQGEPETRRTAPVIRSERLLVDTARHKVEVDGRPVELTPTEFELLAYLAGRRGVVCRRHEIFQQVWGSSWYGSTKTLDVHIASLRRKLGDPGMIETVRGVGYRLNA